MRYSILFFASCVLSIGNAIAQDIQPAQSDLSADLFGHWRVVSINLPQEVPASCLEASIEFRQDHSLRVQSGEQVIEGFFIVEQREGGFLIAQQITRHNGKPNCQGYTAEFVVENTVPNLYAVVEADKLHLYETEETRESLATFSREKK